ncbi:MAG TPA: DUF3347 domain-containing protein [Puia sp.]|nr:DUF3347 domain-containing protein [Puia sp.]
MKSLVTFSLMVALCASLQRTMAQTPDAKTAFNKVIENYLGVKDALSAGNGPQASAHAKDLLESIDAVPAARLTDNQRKIWSAYLPKLEFDSRHISEVDKVPHQREHFTSLSANLFTVLKAIPVNQSVLYEESCTMTKGTFLSASSSGKDPYTGMDNCSKVNATIPATKQ